MALKELTLENLKDTKLQPLFDREMAKILQSLYHENDIAGKRKIAIDITFELDGGNIITSFECEAKIPNRTAKVIAVLEDNQVKIETTSDNAKQPGFEFSEAQAPNVHKITDASSAKKGAAS